MSIIRTKAGIRYKFASTEAFEAALHWGLIVQQNVQQPDTSGVRRNTSGGFKLTADQVVAIRRELADKGQEWGTKAKLARKYGVSGVTIGRINSGDAWRSYGLPQGRAFSDTITNKEASE